MIARKGDALYQWLGAWLYRHGWFCLWFGQRVLDVAAMPMHFLCEGKCDGGCD
jgi:hypothetical protein